MIYLSDLQRRRVVDETGAPLGRIIDVIVRGDDLFPPVIALVVDGSGGPHRMAWLPEGDLRATPIVVPGEAAEVEKNEIWLSRDVLDHQIVDTEGRRVVKVNDVKLSSVRGQARLVGADVSVRGYLRRLGVEGVVAGLHLPFEERLITWNFVEGIEGQGVNLRLTETPSSIFRLHPADIAELVEDMPAEEGAALLGQLSPELAGGALSELDPDTQGEVIAKLGAERAADLLEAMPPDDAADILGELPESQAQQLLAGMEPAEAAEVRDLLRYDDESAGGIMTTEVIAIRQDLTVEDAIATLRGLAGSAEVAYYLFVVDDDNRLVGVVSLRDLVIALPRTRLATIMQTRVPHVTVGADQEEAARLMSKYDLVALPVLDDEGKLTGVITADDIIDVIQEEADEDLSAVAGAAVGDVEGTSGIVESALGRLRWLAVTFAGGLIAAWTLRAFAGPDDLAGTVLAFGPLLVLLAGQVVAQSTAVVTRGVGLGVADALPWREARIGLVLAVVLGAASGLGAALLTGGSRVALAVGLAAAIGTLIAVAIGALLPLLSDRVVARPRLISPPLVGPLAGLLGLLVYLGLANALVN
ncbi:MAG: magnesium transporter [Dehalococcoidia bacterium]